MTARLAWDEDLPWLKKTYLFRHALPNHSPSASDAARLDEYFGENREQLGVVDLNGDLPLHRAAIYLRGEHAVSIVKVLLAAFPSGAQQRGQNGNLPLHCAASHQEGEHGTAIVSLLLAAFPDGVQQKNGNDFLRNLPLHCTLHRDESAIVELLLKAYPQAAQKCDPEGRFALHSAAERRSTLATLTSLLEAYPPAAQQKDMYGRLPADIAHKLLSQSCRKLLRDAAKGHWYPPAPGKHRSSSAALLPFCCWVLDALM